MDLEAKKMFQAKTLEETREAARAAGVRLPLLEDTGILNTPLTVGARTVPNRIAIQPMEGCDGTPAGAPGELTLRRYDRFARSGAGLIWFEACACLEEARANPRQAWLRRENVEDFRRLCDAIRETAIKESGYAPLIVLQATHSGRYSKPHGVPEPIIAYNNPLFEKEPLDASRIITDDGIERAEDALAEEARLAQAAGFDGVDIKACHRYLGSELLSAYTRPGRYGGDFDNRTRFLRNGIAKARAATTGDFLVASRLNIYDGFPYPYGFGVSRDGGLTPDMEEPIRLLRILYEQLNVQLVDITIGNPYVNPHVNRPADQQPYPLPEDPLRGLARMLDCTRAVKAAVPGLAVVGSAMSNLRQFSANLAAGAVEEGICDLAGFGRMAFAYPAFAKDILRGGGLDARQCCVTCGKCSLLMRLGGTAGCVVRDPYYAQHYRELTKN
jgi:2,4-dienoyl-CoA reductase-like NADH-dependent reductase (Old Yellow Enzyme family)